MLENLVRKFLYYPVVLPKQAALPPWAHDGREVWIATSDSNQIHGLYWPARPGRPTILFLHGNAQSVFEWAMVRRDLAAMDCGLLLVDYPGYGKSSGRPGEATLYAAGRAALAWLTETADVPERQTVVMGKSLGGGVASEVARGRKLMGVILESTFRSIPAVARRLLPMLPGDGLLRSERYDTLSRLGELCAPLLVVHGTDDNLIPVGEGRALYQAASEPKQLYLVEGAGHNDVAIVAGESYGRTLRGWLDRVGGQPAR